MNMYLSAGAVDPQKPRAPQSSACSCQFFRLRFGQTSSPVTRLCCVTTCCADWEEWSHMFNCLAVWAGVVAFAESNAICDQSKVDGENKVQCTMPVLHHAHPETIWDFIT